MTAAAAPGGWRVTGAVPVVAGVGVAGRLLVPVMLADLGPPAVLMVPADSAGLMIEDVPTVGGDRAATVRFDDVMASRSAVLGDDPVAIGNALDVALVAQCAELVGASAGALDVAVAYVNERGAVGARWRPFRSCSTAPQTATSMSRPCAGRCWMPPGTPDSGRSFGLVASMAKVVCSEGALRVTAWAQQVHGGEGFYADRDPGLFYRRARALAPRLGDVRWHLARIDALRRDEANG